MANIDILLEALKNLNEDKNSPFDTSLTGDKRKGYIDALKKILQASAPGQQGGQSGSSGQQQKADPRFKQPNINNNNSQNNDSNNNENDSEDKNNPQGNQKQQNNKSNNTLNQPSEKEIAELIDKIQKARKEAKEKAKQAKKEAEKAEEKAKNPNSDSEEAEQAADEAEKAQNDAEKAEEIEKKLDELEDDAEDAESKEEANKLKARLNRIATFWDDEENQKELQRDSKKRRLSKELEKSLRQARSNAPKKNYNYKTLTIKEIVANIMRTIKTQLSSYRDSDWGMYNPRSADLGYIAPGRFTDEKRNKPKVIFYFDVSGSWCGNDIKIAMGHRIEESLKKFHQEGKIDLSCFYFGGSVHTSFTKKDQTNSDEPSIHIRELVETKSIDNIIIMTDNDPSWSGDAIKVPGYAWLLFYDTPNSRYAANLSGKKGTSIFMIDHSAEDEAAKN